MLHHGLSTSSPRLMTNCLWVLLEAGYFIKHLGPSNPSSSDFIIYGISKRFQPNV
jgi:hypothetical protein